MDKSDEVEEHIWGRRNFKVLAYNFETLDHSPTIRMKLGGSNHSPLQDSKLEMGERNADTELDEDVVHAHPSWTAHKV